jgi:hypothetical protein
MDMTIRAVLVCVAVLALAACDDARQAVAPVSVPAAQSTMPPMRVGGCADTALIDERCTAAWYACSDAHNTCSRKWEECCRASTANH